MLNPLRAIHTTCVHLHIHISAVIELNDTNELPFESTRAIWPSLNYSKHKPKHCYVLFWLESLCLSCCMLLRLPVLRAADRLSVQSPSCCCYAAAVNNDGQWPSDFTYIDHCLHFTISYTVISHSLWKQQTHAHTYTLFWQPFSNSIWNSELTPWPSCSAHSELCTFLEQTVKPKPSQSTTSG